jgi:hypothetical protein
MKTVARLIAIYSCIRSPDCSMHGESTWELAEFESSDRPRDSRLLCHCRALTCRNPSIRIRCEFIVLAPIHQPTLLLHQRKKTPPLLRSKTSLKFDEYLIPPSQEQNTRSILYRIFTSVKNVKRFVVHDVSRRKSCQHSVPCVYSKFHLRLLKRTEIGTSRCRQVDLGACETAFNALYALQD